MTVYVDDMRARLGRMTMCHMVADTEAELHEMASKIGVARKWYQGPPKTRTPHYDIALSKRAMAVELGAREITTREAAVLTRAARRANTEALRAASRRAKEAGAR